MARPSAKAPTGHTVLVVDDQEETRVSVRRLLERAGHQVLTAESGPEALDTLAGSEIDLIIVDYFMPQMTGAELVRQIRATHPFVQIILQTGYAGEQPPLARAGREGSTRPGPSLGAEDGPLVACLTPEPGLSAPR